MRLIAVVLATVLGGCGGGGAGDDAPEDGGLDGPAAIDASPDAAPPALGTVVPLPDACQRRSRLPSTTCTKVRVASPGVAPLTAEILVTVPPGDVAIRGTVVLGTGGGGGGIYEQDPVAAAMMTRLVAAGWRVVQRGWDDAMYGWIAGPGGMLALSNRYATLLTWIHGTIHGGSTAHAFCATGNSGGSAELAYALARWGRGDLLDLAVPTGGPPIVALDHFCLDGADPAWLAECRALVPPGTFGAGQVPPAWCSYSPAAAGPRMLVDGAYQPETPCGSVDTAARARLLADSVVAPGAVFAYPRTRVHQILGLQDAAEPVTGGHYFASKLTTDHAMQYVPMTPHAVFSSTNGAAAIEQAIVQGCVPRH